MTKKEIAADIRQQVGNVLCTNQVGEYLGMSPKPLRVFLEGVPCFELGRKKCYFAVDLAQRLVEAEVG